MSTKSFVLCGSGQAPLAPTNIAEVLEVIAEDEATPHSLEDAALGAVAGSDARPSSQSAR